MKEALQMIHQEGLEMFERYNQFKGLNGELDVYLDRIKNALARYEPEFDKEVNDWNLYWSVEGLLLSMRRIYSEFPSPEETFKLVVNQTLTKDEFHLINRAKSTLRWGYERQKELLTALNDMTALLSVFESKLVGNEHLELREEYKKDLHSKWKKLEDWTFNG